VPADAIDYTDTVRRGAYLVTDAQVDAMHAAGLSDDEIFELTVSAAVGAGLERLDAGLKALR
jgi:alkylhydroperoxidase family enzyme